MADFDAILNRSQDEIVEPKPTPVGTWRLRVLNASLRPGKDDGDPFAFIVFQPVEPADDVSVDELAVFNEHGGSESGRIFHRVYQADARDEWNLKSLFLKAGIDVSGMTTKDALTELAKGYELMGYVTQTLGNDGETIYTNVGQFTPIE